jgi:hypothetical protein
MIIDLSLTDVFGPGATQTATTITIAKADLPGLTASPTNNGQQIFVALFLAALSRQQTITTPAGETLQAPCAANLTYPGEQSALKLALWRIFPDSSEYVYTLDICSSMAFQS